MKRIWEEERESERERGSGAGSALAQGEYAKGGGCVQSGDI